jgi:dihydrofolate reductase
LKRTTATEEEGKMGKIVVSQFMTVDGVVEDPGGSEKRPRGGWAFRFDRGPEGDTFKLEELRASDALLLGRTTYEGFAEAWPSRTGDEFSDKFNGMPKYVVSSTLSDPDWNNTTVLSGDVATEVAELKERHDGDILVNGSVQLVQALADAGLVDEYRVMVFPTVIGEGKKLFGDLAGATDLKLTKSQTVGDGVQILVYEPA